MDKFRYNSLVLLIITIEVLYIVPTNLSSSNHYMKPNPFDWLIKDEDEKGIRLLHTIKKTKLINLKTITVSGISSGAGFAVHLHYVFSANIHGVGSFAGGPFGWAYGLIGPTILHTLLNLGARGLLPFIRRTPQELSHQAEELEASGIIDPLKNLKGSKAYVFNGKADIFSSPIFGLQKSIVEMYEYFGADVKKVSPLLANHIIPTDNYGGPCFLFDIGISNCNYQGVFDMFSHLYGSGYIPPKSSVQPLTGRFYRFDQSEFAPNGSRDSLEAWMHDHGGIYIPRACENPTQECHLHFVFHGCFNQFASILTNNFQAKKTGYLQVADSNNIIMVFPYAATIAYKFPDKLNIGCWDWFGFTTGDGTYIGKEGPQIRTVANIVNGIVGKSLL